MVESDFNMLFSVFGLTPSKGEMLGSLLEMMLN